MQEHHFKLITFASNKNGTKIYCRLALNKKTLVKGYYDFNQDKFIIKDYIKRNFIEGITKKVIRQKLKEILLYEYDWEL